MYDIVIIATPLTKDQENQITFENFEKQKNFEFSGEYHTTIATFVRGELNKTYFDLKDDLLGILSCDPDRTIINSIGRVPPVSGDEENTNTWKIFSRKLLGETYLNNIFLHVNILLLALKIKLKCKVNNQLSFRLMKSSKKYGKLIHIIHLTNVLINSNLMILFIMLML